MIKILKGDCRELLKQIDSESIDCVITSPPYDEIRNYNQTLVWNFDVFKDIANELFRVIKKGGVVVWVVGDATIDGDETGTSFRQALYFKEVGFKLHDTMIYQKHNPVLNAGNRYQQCFEYMFVFSKGAPKTTNIMKVERRNECNDKRTQRVKFGNRNIDGDFGKRHQVRVNEYVPRQNIWEYMVGLYNSTSDKEAFQHPAIFPEQLAYDHIVSWTNENDTVLDPFMGSGTVGKMCVLLKRNFIGMEIVDDYVKLSQDRITTTIKSMGEELI